VRPAVFDVESRRVQRQKTTRYTYKDMKIEMTDFCPL
jgi:hypothetical protein